LTIFAKYILFNTTLIHYILNIVYYKIKTGVYLKIDKINKILNFIFSLLLIISLFKYMFNILEYMEYFYDQQ